MFSVVVILGKSHTGKTCLINRFLRSSFELNTRTTLGAAFGQRDIDVDGITVSLGVWDTAGRCHDETCLPYFSLLGQGLPSNAIIQLEL